MPALDTLERIAAKVGWRLDWRQTSLPAHPTLAMTGLEIYDGRRHVNAGQPIWTMHGRDDDGARECIADRVVSSLPRRGARQE